MAHNRVSTLFLITVVLFAAAPNPLAHALGFGFDQRTLIVTGQLCCTTDGNCPGTAVPGAVISLKCPTLLALSTQIIQNTTDLNGVFSITVPSVPALILIGPIFPCFASVQLPLNSTVCSVLSTTNGVLVSGIRSVGSIIGNILGFGTVVSATIVRFVLLTI